MKKKNQWSRMVLIAVCMLTLTGAVAWVLDIWPGDAKSRESAEEAGNQAGQSEVTDEGEKGHGSEGGDSGWTQEDPEAAESGHEESELAGAASGSAYGKDGMADMRDTSKADGKICEYYDISLPECLKKGDLVDLRISFADGSDYTVLSDKRVEECRQEGRQGLLRLILPEEEILLLSGARTDARMLPDTSLYVVVCATSESGAYQANYPASKSVRELIEKSPNVQNTMRLDKSKELDDLRKEGGSSQKSTVWEEPIQYWKEGNE